MKKCGDCDKLDRESCYSTATPKFDCKITGQCHFLDDVCDAKEEMDKQDKPLSEWTLGGGAGLLQEADGESKLGGVWR